MSLGIKRFNGKKLQKNEFLCNEDKIKHLHKVEIISLLKKDYFTFFLNLTKKDKCICQFKICYNFIKH